MPTLDRITVHPVKSLDGVEVTAARLLPGGGLEHDRRWRLVMPYPVFESTLDLLEVAPR